MSLYPTHIREERTYTKQLERMPRDVAVAALEAVCLLATTGVGDVTKLKNRAGLFRLRVGDVRIFFMFISEKSPHEQHKFIALFEIKWRGGAYK